MYIKNLYYYKIQVLCTYVCMLGIDSENHLAKLDVLWHKLAFCS